MPQVQLPLLTKFTQTINSILIKIKKLFRIAAPVLLYLIISFWTFPAQADTKIAPKLEEQVLQVLREHPEAIIESVQAYQQQQQQKMQKVQQAFVQVLKTNPTVVIEDSPTTGANDAKIVLVEFSDFQCPYCAQAHNTVKEFMAKHQNEVKLVYKHMPLVAVHPEAVPAAKAAWAANKQGKFWEYHDALFTQQDKLGDTFYTEIAKNLNLDVEKFNSDRNSETANAAIQKDAELAQVLGVTGTPFFVMNDQGFSGAVALSEMEKILGNVKKL